MNNHLGIICFNYLYINVQVRKISQILSFQKNKNKSQEGAFFDDAINITNPFLHLYLIL